MPGAHLRSRLETAVAVLLPLAAILIVTWPNLRGRYGIGSETVFDLQDPLFGDYKAPPARNTDDSTPVQYDWPRDRRLIERVHQGHFDLWDPIPGNGAPLAPNPGGVFSPLRLVLYAAPLAPYTAFVLFRVFKLLVAAAGAFLLARAYGLSLPASTVASAAFGLSGGMVSQVPFATVASVCWLPWVCWGQLRVARQRTLTALVPMGLAVAATLTGGHQTIILAMMLGALAHALGLVAVQAGWADRRRAALLLVAGYAIGLLLAAPNVLASAELVANGHSYKLTGTRTAFRQGAVVLNRGLLFVAAVLPRTIDALRDRGGGMGYPYTLNFALGATAYLLAAVCLVWRRWRLEWIMLLALGIAFCFDPPGVGWLGTLPFIKDILPRYTWSLCVLPLTVAAGIGVDLLWEAAGYRRGALFVPLDSVDGPPRWPRGALTTTVMAAAGVVAVQIVVAALLMWKDFHDGAAVVVTLLDTVPAMKMEVAIPLVGAAAAVMLAAVAARKRWPWGRWLLAAVACIESAAIARPQLRDAPSQRVRAAASPEVASLAGTVEAEHARVGGNSATIIGWGGWRESRALTPIAPLRYARFIEASTGPVTFTTFTLAQDRSALTDLAGIRYLIVPRRDEPTLDKDPVVTKLRNILGVSVYRNEGALPRARVVHRTILAPSIDDAVANLAKLTREVDHVATTPLVSAAIIEPQKGAPPPRLLQGGLPSPVEFVVDRPDDVVLKINPPEPGYLVLSDTYFPGWKAIVDGREQPIYPANVGFRAVYVEAGPHRVAFRYRPTSFRAGIACTLFGALVCAAILLRDARRKERWLWRQGRRALARIRRRRGAPPPPPPQRSGDGDGAGAGEGEAGRTARPASISPSGV